jgi:RNA polymerase sigma factor (sigma-70 family)
VATRQTSQVLDHFRKTILRQDGTALSDAQVLDCFVRNRDEAAFAALVQRHGPMVWGVCRRVLADHHDAEDAFQATFIVLVRRAASVVPREMVANWLYGVAHQTALKARALAGKRRAREMPTAHLPETAAPGQDPWDDLRPLLDQELSRLPDKYRVAIVLCDLEGKTRKAAAAQLRLPEGTVSSRLSTARALLAKRLARRGLTLSAGALAALLTEHAASASVPRSVLSSTIQAASVFAAGGAVSPHVAALTEGVFAMSRIRWKIAAAAVLMSALAYGVILPFFAARAAGQGDPAARAQDRQAKSDARKNVLSLRVRLDKVDAQGRTLSARVVSDLERVERMYPVKDLVVPINKKLDVKTAEDLYDLASRQPTQLLNLPVAKDAKVTEGGKAMKLTDLKAGTVVTLDLAADARGLVVVGIRKSDRKVVRPAGDAEELAVVLQVILEESKAAEKKEAGAPKDRAALQGTWHVAAVETFMDGAQRRSTAKGARWVFLGDQIARFDPRASDPENDAVFRFELESAPRAKGIRLTVVEGRAKGRVYFGIYGLEGNTLRILLQTRQGAARPTGFTPREDEGFVLWELRRPPSK